mgnify:CR=1 FL=1
MDERDGRGSGRVGANLGWVLAVVALVADGAGDRHVLFCREKNLEREIWDGFRYGPDAAKDIFGFDEAHPIGELDRMLPDFASARPELYTPVGMHADWCLRGGGRFGFAEPLSM